MTFFLFTYFSRSPSSNFHFPLLRNSISPLSHLSLSGCASRLFLNHTYTQCIHTPTLIFKIIVVHGKLSSSLCHSLLAGFVPDLVHFFNQGYDWNQFKWGFIHRVDQTCTKVLFSILSIFISSHCLSSSVTLSLNSSISMSFSIISFSLYMKLQHVLPSKS